MLNTFIVILDIQALHPETNHNLGVIAVTSYKTNIELPLFKTALEINPKIRGFVSLSSCNIVTKS